MISRFEFSDDGVSSATGMCAPSTSPWHRRRGSVAGSAPQRLGGFLGNVFRMPSNVSNTNIVSHANGLFSLWEGGRPYRIDPETLETRRTETFDGTLKHMGAFSAHPKIDVATGRCSTSGWRCSRGRCCTFCRDAHGRMKVLAPVKLSRPVLCHDFALTEHYLVFLIDPIVFSRPITAALGLDSMDHCLSFEEKQGTRVVLVPRDGGKPRVVDTEALFHFHNANAWERTATSSSSSSHIPPRRRGIRSTGPPRLREQRRRGLRGHGALAHHREPGHPRTPRRRRCEFPSWTSGSPLGLTRPRMWPRRRCPAGNRTHWSASITRPVGGTCSPSPPATPFASRSSHPIPRPTVAAGCSASNISPTKHGRGCWSSTPSTWPTVRLHQPNDQSHPMGFHGTFVPAASWGTNPLTVSAIHQRFGDLAAWW